MDDHLTDEERSEQVRGVLVKALVVLVVIGVLIFLGTTIMVRALGLNEGSGPGPVGAGSDGPSKALPSTALPVPGEKSEEPPLLQITSGPAATTPGHTVACHFPVEPGERQQ